MRLQLMKLDKLDGNVILYQIELQMLELGHMFQIKIIGLKIKIIGLKKLNS